MYLPCVLDQGHAVVPRALGGLQLTCASAMPVPVCSCPSDAEEIAALYNMACAYSQLGERAAAITCLEAVLENGEGEGGAHGGGGAESAARALWRVGLGDREARKSNSRTCVPTCLVIGFRVA